MGDDQGNVVSHKKKRDSESWWYRQWCKESQLQLHLFNVQKVFFFSCYPKFYMSVSIVLVIEMDISALFKQVYLFRHEWKRNYYTESSGLFTSQQLVLNIFIKALLGSIINKNIHIILVKLFLTAYIIAYILLQYH